MRLTVYFPNTDPNGLPSDDIELELDKWENREIHECISEILAKRFNDENYAGIGYISRIEIN